MQRQGDRGGPSSCLQLLSIHPRQGSRRLPDPARQVCCPPQPLGSSGWRRRQPPSCWLSLPGWCHPRGTKVSAGERGHSLGLAACAALLPLRAPGGKGWRVPGYSDGREHQCLRYGVPVGVSCGHREQWRGCWQASREEQKTSLSSSHPRLRERRFALAPAPTGPSQMFAGRSTQFQPPHGRTLLLSRSQASFRVVPPSLLPFPPLATLPALLGMFLPRAARWPQVRKHFYLQ